MTAREALAAAERRLDAAGIDTPRVDAELLVAHVLGTTRSGVYADLDREVDGSLEPLLARREQREPLAYVLGEWGFRRLTAEDGCARARAATGDGDRRRARARAARGHRRRRACSTSASAPARSRSR